MELQRRGPAGEEIPVVVDEGRAFDLRPLTGDIDGAFLAGDGIAGARSALAAGELTELDVSGLRHGAPVARPGAVVCIGQNYAAHAAESGSPPPPEPIIFFKHPNTVIGAYDEVHLPPGSAKTDWEVELAVIIGRQARYLASPADALSYIAGYAVSNDVSERTYQSEVSGGQWSKGKCCETFNPLGPSLIPADQVDPTNLRLQSWVNDEPRQDSTTGDMIFSVAQLIYELSQFLVLDPGDVINTGTPQGVALSGRFPFLGVGDEMRLVIEGLGEQRQQIIAAPGVPAAAGAANIAR
ncbi:fumarylacetoacetate hydrolase family protein [Microlunatus speluncae]|uniref:fumarylacetoacetate hydrolase family protein n=1 Tax=Microlunatus speluncae TaxID=2594267 RepID=UPI0012664ABE|nr:fumarylacetoacetate hydrolase family protein [Microlunatus speluncae]